MTGAACGAGGILTVYNFQRFVYGMTRLAGGQGLVGNMGLMALHAGGNQAMAGVTSSTTLFRMAAWELLQLSHGVSVTRPAGISNIGRRNDQRSVRVGVAFETGGKILTMGQIMTVSTLRNYLRPVLANGIIGMQLLMTVLAVEAMLLTMFLDILINSWVTLATLHRSQWNGVRTVHVVLNRLSLSRSRLNSKKTKQGRGR